MNEKERERLIKEMIKKQRIFQDSFYPIYLYINEVAVGKI
jgi:hypothetical protein